MKYLDDVYHATAGRIQWAMLTNGKQWRFFYYRASSRSGNFFEIDLEEIILRNDANTFLYFYLFFSKDALVPDAATGKTWLEQHLKETEEYAARVSDKLKNLIFDHIFEGLATGFIEYRNREKGITEETDESLKEIFNGCLTLLYRLLFLLYAESRGLLPVNDSDRYYKKSLKKTKEDVNDELEKSGLDGMTYNAYDYWSRLESLFRIIDKGDRALNVPIYNGGLFETSPDSFLSKHKIPDPYIAKAIEQLTVDPDIGHTPGVTPFIDYSSLNVRHLGDIYEGLLEFHIRIANDTMVEIREKGKSFWRKRSDVKEGVKTYRSKKKGEAYIENSKHERKASGSYYTPHYIVEYIVGNTVGPVLRERRNRAESFLAELDKLYAKQRKQLNKPREWNHWEHPGEPKGKYINDIVHKENQVFETLFDIKVLDPAMGSGHFLVHTVDFISDKIITFLADYPDNPVVRRIDELRNDIISNIKEQKVTIDESKLTEVNLIKRMVMKRCIYGVDLNEMAVELSKLSLWLDSFTLGAPLSFLDHHLKYGNSLIGTNIEELEKALTGHLFGINLEPLKRALRDMIFVSELPDATVAQVKESYKKYGEANKGLAGYKILLDMLIVEHFGIPDAKKFLVSDFDKIDLNRLHDSLASLPASDRQVIQQVKTLAGEKRFFHWEIEFPEVFYERTASGQQIVKQGNPGFNCVIGNPPYVRQEELGSLKKDYLKPYYKVFHSAADLYAYFFERGIDLLKIAGTFGMITSNKFIKTNYGAPLRKYLSEKSAIKEIVDFGELPVFREAATFPAIVIVERSPDDLPRGTIKYAPIRSLSFDSLAGEINKSAIAVGQEALNAESWSLAEEEVSRVFKKMEFFAIPLKQYCNGKIKYGVKTGLNEAFVIDRNTKDVLVKEDSKSRDFIKPLIVGDDVRKYEIDYKESFIIIIPSSFTKSGILREILEEHGFIAITDEIISDLLHVVGDRDKWGEKCGKHNLECAHRAIWQDINKKFQKGISNAFVWFSAHYPAIAKHLKKFEEKALRRSDKGDFWWELRPCDYYDYFDMPKIVYPEIALESRFAFDDTAAYPLKTVFTIPMDDKYLLTILNSKAAFGYLKSICSVLGDTNKRGRLLLQLIYLEKLLVPRISFNTADKERKERVREAIVLYQKELASVASNADKWQNKGEDKGYDKDSDKKGAAKPGRVAEAARGYEIPEEGVSGKGAGLGSEIHGVREGASEYDPSEGDSEAGQESTRPADSTRYFETAQGVIPYSEVSEKLAISVAKTIQSIIDKNPAEIAVASEWLCSVHRDIAWNLFPDWAGRLRDVNVQVGAHTPPPYYEVPVHLRLYCDDLSARLSSVDAGDIEAVAELLAFADWRFQWIHPFKDFNGRVGRILLSALLYKLKLPPAETAAVDPDGRKEYLGALQTADNGNMLLLKNIWLERLLNAAQERG